MKKKILFITTGGTIASSDSGDGLKPTVHAATMLEELGYTASYDFVISEPFQIDSSNMRPSDWNVLMESIRSHSEGCDGVVVLHGTDTMAYTASALSYMLLDFPLPVVITGSQKPIHAEGTDAIRNITCAIEAAASAPAPLVMIAFANHIMLGCHTSKVSADRLAAFHTLYGKDIGYFRKGQMHWYKKRIDKLLSARRSMPCCAITGKTFLLKLVPGISSDICDFFHGGSYQALVIEGFGSGGIPNRKTEFLNKLQKLVDEGMIVVCKTQCFYGKTDMSIYEVGRLAMDAGVISMSNITTEALVTKLMWLLSLDLSTEEIKEALATNYAGELVVI